MSNKTQISDEDMETITGGTAAQLTPQAAYDSLVAARSALANGESVDFALQTLASNVRGEEGPQSTMPQHQPKPQSSGGGGGK